jgi:cation-transporting ATPase 13A1
MITGDNALTACHVARNVGIADEAKEFVSLVIASEEDGVVGSNDDDHNAPASRCRWVDASGATVARFDASVSALRALFDRFEMCVTGPALVEISDLSQLAALLPFATVYARTTPDQKAVVLSAFNDAGLQTLMCGDGTNDVAALRRAHVGIALTPGHVVAKGGKRGNRAKRGVSEQQALEDAALE